MQALVGRRRGEEEDDIAPVSVEVPAPDPAGPRPQVSRPLPRFCRCRDYRTACCCWRHGCLQQFHFVSVSVRCSGEKGMDIDCHTVEFDDVRYHIQVSSVLCRVIICSKNSGRWANYGQQMNGMPPMWHGVDKFWRPSKSVSNSWAS